MNTHATGFDAFDHACMAEALRLAERGAYTTHPNPRVGCVLARDGQVIARGWHERAGAPHAETVALNGAAGAARGSTAYVTLEPCAHHGRTAPCADALLDAGVARVVAAAEDPDPRVRGAGLARLSGAGVDTSTGLLAEQAEALNPGFFHRHRIGRPWVRVKLALSLDGRSALADGQSQWITSSAARRDGHRWRARAAAVATGIGTVLADDPRLDARDVAGVLPGPRIVFDSDWRTPPGARLFEVDGPVWVLGRDDRDPPGPLAKRARCLPAGTAQDGRLDLAAALRALAAEDLGELHVEAGATLVGALLKAKLVDELLMYQAPVLLGRGGRGAAAFGPIARMDDRLGLVVHDSRRVGPDLRLRLRPAGAA
ncbi:MAG: bifunctional diaminohydroxyphosphoribosylaminopyrimidine deaminase/5-amino-6-(5-phosphoribosylamino)uracil reductase RibD [Xanthomonadales bacterium]|nr:bifunctional diaminohydroxyphosphoribosylaminopyrimidine deaminase/5-amino-6-(5-phosphoribosylamino)uracil reductase RibD [Xanthomonadales bacterium]